VWAAEEVVVKAAEDKEGDVDSSQRSDGIDGMLRCATQCFVVISNA
jgi:hypothetical protein